VTLQAKISLAKELFLTNLEKYPNSAIACSFGKDSLVLLDIARQIVPDIKVFSVLADTEFPETVLFKDELISKWNLNYQEYLFEQKHLPIDACCQTKKIEKFKEAVSDLDLWYSAIRKDEGGTRKNFSYIEEKGGLIKVNPILDFTERDVWRYLAIFQVPINPLYRLGYRSLGCARCSFVEESESENERDGRWKGTKNVGGECGIHTKSLR
jgi:phosphoadenosine phosphosulfate reductase